MSSWISPANVPWMTKLQPWEEAMFRLWVKANKIPFDPNNAVADYDMRGYWKALISGDPKAKQSASTGHFPDTWKTPFHQSFSNESIYRTPNAPHWEKDKLVPFKGFATRVPENQPMSQDIEDKRKEKYRPDDWMARWFLDKITHGMGWDR